MEATVEREAASFCVATTTTGRCFTLNMSATSLLSMEVMVVATSVMAPMARTSILMYLVVLWYMMQKQVSMSAMLPMMVRRLYC